MKRAALLLIAGLGSQAVWADTVVTPTPSTLSPNETLTYGGTPIVGDPTSSSGGISVYNLANPGTYNYGQSFNTALQTFSVTSGSSTTSDAFYSDYVFTIAPGTVDSLSSTVNLGSTLAVNGLQARLYAYNVNNGAVVQNLTVPALSSSGTGSYNSIPLNGTVYDAWSQTVNIGPGQTGTFADIPQTTLGAGTYVLEIRAASVGGSGGSYSGVLNIAPVPLPAALPLLLSGLGLMGTLRRRPSRARWTCAERSLC
jgi:hypothetical protein